MLLRTGSHTAHPVDTTQLLSYYTPLLHLALLREACFQTQLPWFQSASLLLLIWSILLNSVFYLLYKYYCLPSFCLSRVTSTLLMVSAISCMNNSYIYIFIYIKSVCWTWLTGNWMPQHSPSLEWFLITKWPPPIRAVILHSPLTAHIQATTKFTFRLPCALFSSSQS